MKIEILSEKFSKKIYNQLAAHPLQSWQWGQARKKMGIEVLRIVETHHDASLQNVYQLTFHKIPHINFKIGYLPRSKFPSKELLEYLYDYGKRHNVVFIKIEPYVFNNLAIQQFSNLVKSPHPLFPKWTQIIDLTKNEEELLRGMHPKTRYNIRLAQKKGVKIKELSNREGFNIFIKLYFETCKRQKYFGHDLNYHKIIWQNLKNKISHLLIAFYKNTPLAAFELFFFKKTLYYPYGGTSLEFRNLMASNLLMWEAVRLGKSLGAKEFDLWGSLSPAYQQNHPWAGFTRFKEGFGGNYREFAGSFDLVCNPQLFKFYNLLFDLRSVYLKFKR